MDKLKTLLIANRGEIACRIMKTAKKLNVHTIAIYTDADAASLHVIDADEAVLLLGDNASAYLDGNEIIKIAQDRGADAIIPGYGFLSENANFARAVSATGMAFVGPSPECLESFGIKHVARNLAEKAGVPIVPGSKGLVDNVDDAVKESSRLGFPVMLKATAGGGGMGLHICRNDQEVSRAFALVQSRGEILFKNAGLFVEKYYAQSHHIEVQVFGNGQGQAIAFGERECSIQRRHQKVIEECPSPFVERHPGLREKLESAAIRLAESINYGSVGTVEYLVDDETADFFFLEMNTRLQVEHGITELCYGIDLVELMLRQAEHVIKGEAGMKLDNLATLSKAKACGAAIECRVYAENPSRDYSPSPGTLQLVEWACCKGCRIDTWVRTGNIVSSYYDPLLAKLMFHSPTREESLKGMHELLTKSRICGPPTNISLLSKIVIDPGVKRGNTLTRFLDDFTYNPAAIDFISGGAYTQVQDYPGRPSMGKGFPHAGPMDPLAFQIANLLVANPRGKEGLEITLDGPEMVFLGPAVVALCGASTHFTLDSQDVPMWSRVSIKAGQRLKIGKTTGGGCRAYLAIHGGLPSVAEWFGSKATSPGVGVGGYQGRQLASGDLLAIVENLPEELAEPSSLPESLIPRYPSHWDIMAMPGPYDEGYLLPEDIETIYDTKWQVSHNAARGGIRLIGPKPKWARKDGGEGGAHPSNVVEYGYPVGTLNWTGDDPCVFPVDCPDFGGFVSSTTIIKAEFWRLGQAKAGDTIQYRRVSLEDALLRRKRLNEFVDQIAQACCAASGFERISPLDSSSASTSHASDSQAIVHTIGAQGSQPKTLYRQGADDYLLVEYGEGTFDLNHRCRVTALTKALKEAGPKSVSESIINTVGCCTSLLIYYDGYQLAQRDLINRLVELESQIGDVTKVKVPSRHFRLPITFDSHREKAAIQRYIETQRPYASYLPDNMEFVAKNNGLERMDLEHILLSSRLMTVSVGFFAALPLCLPIDPRHRIMCPKMNPSRVFTPAGQVSWGGSCMALYNVESPGGYMLTGLTIPCVDILGSKSGYSLSRPWLFEDFDQISFYPVSEAEHEHQLALFRSGRYVYQFEDCEFDMAQHNLLLAETRSEVREMRERQRVAQQDMDRVEKELMERWTAEKAQSKLPGDKVEALLNDPAISKIESPLSANVWKVTVSEGDVVQADTVVAILEAMKLEIAVRAEHSVQGSTIAKLMVKPGEVVKAGDALILVKK